MDIYINGNDLKAFEGKRMKNNKVQYKISQKNWVDEK
jgi:hypothetical protein